MARALGTDPDPSPTDDDFGDTPPPKGTGTGAAGRSPRRPATLAEQGRSLPIVYGRARVPGLLIEKQAPTLGTPPRRTTATSYEAGQYVTVLTNCVTNGFPQDCSWCCTQSGVSSALADFQFIGFMSVGSSYTEGVTGGAVWKLVAIGQVNVSTHTFVAALCEGEIAAGISLWWDKLRAPAISGTKPGCGMTLLRGVDAATQSIHATFDQSAYQHTALVYATNAPSGTKTESPDIAVEVDGVSFGMSPDVNPADIVNDLLTHARRGCAWPGSRVDSSITGAGASSFRTYCDCAGLRLSLVVDSQRSALQILADLLTATNSEAVWSGNALKIVPLGDQSITGAARVFGAIDYVPATTAIYNLGLNDFLDKENPVEMSHRGDSKCFNAFPIEYVDRSLAYASTVVEDQIIDNIEVRGALARAQTRSIPVVFPDTTRPAMLSRIMGQRSINVRNEYRFRLSWRHILIEPTDILTLTEPACGLSLTPVRVTQTTVAPDGSVEVIAEDFPAGVQAAVAYTPQVGDGYQPNELVSASRMPITLGLGTSLGAGVSPGVGTIGATQLVPGGVPFSATTQSTPNDNLWPNPTSEIAPPAGADLSQPEWAGRVASGSAYAGSFVRLMEDGNSINHVLPARPGDSFYLEAQSRVVWGIDDGSFNDSGVYLWWAPANGSGAPGVWTQLARGFSGNGTWTLLTAAATLPATAAFVRVMLGAQEGSGRQFDSILFRRMVNASVIEAAAVGTQHIAPGAVNTAALATAAVQAAQLAAGCVTTPAIATGAVVAKAITVANWDNLWPNGSSEASFPTGGDANDAEWAGLTNLGAGAFAGAWVRRVTGANATIQREIPALPGESYYIEARVKAVVAGANKGAMVHLRALDNSGSLLGSASGALNDTTSWALSNAGLVMPAGTTRLIFRLLNGSDAAADAYFDAIFARRMNDANLIVDGTITAAKIAAGTIQTSNYAETAAAAWAANTLHSAGDVRKNDGGKLYRCTKTGTSAASGGPTGTGAGISDNTCVWDYIITGDYASAGAKLDHQGTALKVAADNLLLGTTLLKDYLFAGPWMAMGVLKFDLSAASGFGSQQFLAGALNLNATVSCPSGSTVNLLRVTLKNTPNGRDFAAGSWHGVSPGTAIVATLPRQYPSLPLSAQENGWRAILWAVPGGTNTFDLKLVDATGAAITPTAFGTVTDVRLNLVFLFFTELGLYG